MNKTELPKQFNTWVEFLDDANSRPFKVTIHLGVKLDIIKDNAIEELLDERFERKEALALFSRLHLMIYDKITPTNGLGTTLSRLKRIILTQAKNEK